MEPNREPAKPQIPHGIPASLLWSCAVFFLLIVLAVTLPEYLDYCLLSKQLDFQQKQPSAATNAPPPMVGTNVTTTQVTTNKEPVPTPWAQPSTQIKIPSDRLFESYGRFLTLIVGLLSVLGVFFGYFVQKSLRETEKDLNDKLEKSV